MPDSKLSSALEEIRERDKRVWDGRGNVGGLLAINDARNDVPRLLAALDEVLRLHEPRRRPQALGGHLVCTAEVTGTPWPCETHLAISRHLLGDDGSDG